MNKTPVIQRAIHKSGLYLKKYSPVALSCVASVGVIVTVVTAVKATPKAVELVKADSRKNHDGDPYAYTRKEAFMSAWKCYIPTAAFGLSTISLMSGIHSATGLKSCRTVRLLRVMRRRKTNNEESSDIFSRRTVRVNSRQSCC